MPSLTVIVPALNEQGNLSDTVEEMVPLLEKHFQDYEILIFNDGSTDRTGEIANGLSSKNDKVKVTHNPSPMGLGYNYKRGVRMAVKDYVVMIPGDNDILKESYEGMFKSIGEKEMIVAYTGNMEIRPWSRRAASKTFTGIMNFLFGLNLNYFNGIVIHQRSLIQSITIQTDSFAYQAEALIKLIKSGHSYKEVPQTIRARRYGKSKALHPKNLARVFTAIISLLVEIYFRK